MGKSKSTNDPFEGLWKFFASIKLSVVLLLILAVTSIFGTVIPQNADPAEYLRAFGRFFYNLFHALDLFDMYHSWWFQLLLFLLVVNIVVCSIERLGATWKIVFKQKPAFNPDRFRRLSNRKTFDSDQSVTELQERFAPLIARKYRFHRIENNANGNGICLFAEKGRWGRLGVYTVHLSVILLLLGGIIGSRFGFDGYVNIPEGEATDVISLRNQNRRLKLPFTIRCDDFDVSYYDSGAPKEFRSSLTLLNNGKPVAQKDIIVNDPLRHAGISIYQASLGEMGPKAVTLKFTNRQSQMEYERRAQPGKPIDLPEGGGRFIVEDFRHADQFRSRNIGETFIGTLTPTDGPAQRVRMPVQFPEFDQMRKGQWVISVVDYEKRYYTGLQVARDPGVGVVYTGFIIMIIGCYITFFVPHQRVCIEISRRDNQTQIAVAGTTSQNKVGMENAVQLLVDKLKKLA